MRDPHNCRPWVLLVTGGDFSPVGPSASLPSELASTLRKVAPHSAPYGDSRNTQGLQNRSQYTMILIIRTAKKAPFFWKPPSKVWTVAPRRPSCTEVEVAAEEARALSALVGHASTLAILGL